MVIKKRTLWIMGACLVLAVAGIGGWVWHATQPQPLTAMGSAQAVQCVTMSDPSTCTPLRDPQTTFAPTDRILLSLAFNQPTDTQHVTLLPHMADGSSNILHIAPLSHVTTTPILVMRACDLGSQQSRADDDFDILYDGQAIGHFAFTVQSPDGVTPSAHC